MAGEHPVAALSRVYLEGNGPRINRLAIEIRETLSYAPEFFDLPTGRACGTQGSHEKFDFKRDYALLTWVGTDALGRRVIFRIGVHQGISDPYNVTLPGLSGRSLKRNSNDSADPSHAL
jgi:hypothetical protein